LNSANSLFKCSERVNCQFVNILQNNVDDGDKHFGPDLPLLFKMDEIW